MSVPFLQAALTDYEPEQEKLKASNRFANVVLSAKLAQERREGKQGAVACKDAGSDCYEKDDSCGSGGGSRAPDDGLTGADYLEKNENGGPDCVTASAGLQGALVCGDNGADKVDKDGVGRMRGKVQSCEQAEGSRGQGRSASNIDCGGLDGRERGEIVQGRVEVEASGSQAQGTSDEGVEGNEEATDDSSQEQADIVGSLEKSRKEGQDKVVDAESQGRMQVRSLFGEILGASSLEGGVGPVVQGQDTKNVAGNVLNRNNTVASAITPKMRWRLAKIGMDSGKMRTKRWVLLWCEV